MGTQGVHFNFMVITKAKVYDAVKLNETKGAAFNVFNPPIYNHHPLFVKNVSG